MPGPVELLSDHTGARIRGIELAKSVLPDAAVELRQALARHGVLVFPEQALDEEAHVAACRIFGDVHAECDRDGRERPRIRYVSNDPDVGDRQILPKGKIEFHSDQCFSAAPYRATTLYAIEAPEAGGETLFANAMAACGDLPRDLRFRLDGLRAVNTYDGARTQRPDQSGTDASSFAHPCLVAHPDTGSAVIYVNRLMSMKIDGLPDEEGAEILERLFDLVESPKYRISHRWAKGDFVIWDNIALQHARSDFAPTTRRVLRRIAVGGATLEPAR